MLSTGINQVSRGNDPARAFAVVGGVTVLLVAWFLTAAALHNPALLPSPVSVAARLVRDSHNPLFWHAFGRTVTEASLGCLLGVVAALPLAYVIYKSWVLDAAFGPIIAVSQAIPSVAVAPLLVIWIGYGTFAIAVLCSLIVFFPILVTAVLGLKSLPRDVIEAARLDGAHGVSLLRHIEAPLALPALLAGLRTGVTLSVIGAVVGEFVMGGSGLGSRLSLQSAAADMTGLFATVTVLCLMAALAFQTIALVERTNPIMRALAQGK